MDEADYGTVTCDESSEFKAHGCDHCGVSEVHPLSGTKAGSDNVVIKCRGSRVLHGARNKYEFFQWAIKGLSKAQESSEDSPPLSSNNSDDWILHLVFYGARREDRLKMKYARVEWTFLGGTQHIIAGLDF